MVRKMGGFTFQELNLAIDDIKAMGESGADLSYDFVTRPGLPPRAGHRRHRVPAADAEHRRGASGSTPPSLVHALQNHDELTHELVHFSTRHRDDLFTFRGEELTRVRARRAGPRRRSTRGLTGPARAYNRTLHAPTASPARRRP